MYFYKFKPSRTRLFSEEQSKLHQEFLVSEEYVSLGIKHETKEARGCYLNYRSVKNA